MSKIPKQLQNEQFRFILVGSNKIPIEQDWQNTNNYKFDDSKLIQHLNNGGNYGVLGGYGGLIIIDWDNEEFRTKLAPKLEKTFTVRTGNGGDGLGGYHNYFITKNGVTDSFKILNGKKETLADIQGTGKQVIGAGSRHPTGGLYQVFNDIDITEIDYAELKAIFSPWLKNNNDNTNKKSYPKDNSIDEIKRRLSVPSLLFELGVNTSRNPTSCPFHSSKGGKCLSFTDELWNCFHCEESGDVISLYMLDKNCNFLTAKNELIKKLDIKVDVSNNTPNTLLTRRGQIEAFWQEQPFYYDKNKIFWIWDMSNYCWKKSDEVEYLNSIQAIFGIETINSKTRTELVEGFKQVGRLHKPDDPEKSWIQFKDKIYDVKTGQIIQADPKYFIANPIPWRVGDSFEVPTIHKLFEEWVGKENVQMLYELCAYSMGADKFMQRIFALTGGGSNGKGTFIQFLIKFIGFENVTVSDLRQISDNRFETASLYRKLLCVMGEVTYDDLKNTNEIKKLSGEDTIRFEFKGKDQFSAPNTATCICLTNALPTTPDRSLGFYRRWHIIDFPNQFTEIKKDLITDIPNAEYENFARKCLDILQELYRTQKFTNEGDFMERMRRYEQRSNPVMQFIDECCKDETGSMTPIREFTTACNNYLTERHLRNMTARQIGKILRNEGFMVGSRKLDEGSAVVIMNLTLYHQYQQNQQESNSKSYIETNSTFDSFAGNNGKDSEKTKPVEEFVNDVTDKEQKTISDTTDKKDTKEKPVEKNVIEKEPQKLTDLIIFLMTTLESSPEKKGLIEKHVLVNECVARAFDESAVEEKIEYLKWAKGDLFEPISGFLQLIN